MASRLREHRQHCRTLPTFPCAAPATGPCWRRIWQLRGNVTRTTLPTSRWPRLSTSASSPATLASGQPPSRAVGSSSSRPRRSVHAGSSRRQATTRSPVARAAMGSGSGWSEGRQGWVDPTRLAAQIGSRPIQATATVPSPLRPCGRPLTLGQANALPHPGHWPDGGCSRSIDPASSTRVMGVRRPGGIGMKAARTLQDRGASDATEPRPTARWVNRTNCEDQTCESW